MARGGAFLTPSEILRLTPSEADELLDRLERRVPVSGPLVELPVDAGTDAIVFGDTHGDWRTTEEVVNRFRAGDGLLIGLGDYIDRAPEDCGAGSVANALYLLGLSAEFPDRVHLIQGNHEATRRIPVLPHNLPEEVDELWGPDSTRYDRILGLFERGPMALTTSNGAYLAHAGFPREKLPSPWTHAFDRVDDERLSELTWAECDVSRARRGAARPWGERDLVEFLVATGLRIFLRGHDPDINGRPLCGGRALTLHTTRVYERFGGVLIARLPLKTALKDVGDLKLEHLPTEGKVFSLPE